VADPFVDTDVIIRLLTGDDPVKQAAAAKLFEKVESGSTNLSAPVTVIADAVYVLSSRRLYNLPLLEVRELLVALLRMPRFRVANKSTVLEALDLYAVTNLDFGDAFIAASMREAGSEELYSFDRDFDRVPGVVRLEP